MKAFILACLLMVACDAPVKPADTCKDDPMLNELTSAKKQWGGQVWCPVNMEIEIREIDDAGNALCTYVSTCGVPYQIAGCSPSYGVHCVKWMHSPDVVDRLSIVTVVKGQ